MSFGNRKPTKKELEKKMSNMLIDHQRRLQAKDYKIAKMQKAVEEIQKASDILMGYVIRAYGFDMGGVKMLDLPKCDERYRISITPKETGYLLTAVEIQNDAVHDDN